MEYNSANYVLCVYNVQWYSMVDAAKEEIVLEYYTAPKLSDVTENIILLKKFSRFR